MIRFAALGVWTLALSWACVASAPALKLCEGCDFAGAALANADFTDGVLIASNFEGAVLSGSSFRGARVIAANFSNVRMVAANFKGFDSSVADLRGTNFAGAALCENSLGRIGCVAAPADLLRQSLAPRPAATP